MRKKLNKKVLFCCAMLMGLFMISAAASNVVMAKKGQDTSKQNIAEVVSKKPEFSTLSTALQAADLTDTLKEQGPFTLFAPTDDAFKKLPNGTLEDLLKPENKEKLKDTLLYHVASGKVLAADAKALVGQDITMANGKKARITEKDGALYINGAKIITADIPAKNGVIHSIDSVLTPESK